MLASGRLSPAMPEPLRSCAAVLMLMRLAVHVLEGRRTACLAELEECQTAVTHVWPHACCGGEMQLPLLEDSKGPAEPLTLCTAGALLVLHSTSVPSAADADAASGCGCMHCLWLFRTCVVRHF